MPTTEVQGKNNSPAVLPQPSLTTKTLVEASENKKSEYATEVTADTAMRKIGASSSLTDNAKIQQQNQHKIDDELTSSSSSTIEAQGRSYSKAAKQYRIQS
jgi:hypothetical protein